MNVKARRLLIIPAILFGVAVLVMMTKGKMDAPRVEKGERATAVRYITVQSQDIIPTATGNGNVTPTRVWAAVSQVQGRVVELSDQYRVGMMIRQGALLLSIDDADYQLALSQIKATIEATKAQLIQLEIREDNLGETLVIERAVFDSAKNEWLRLEKLAKQGTVSTSTLEAQQRAYLGQKKQLQSVGNSLALSPSEQAVVKAQLVQQQAQLAQAELNLKRTKVYAPFNARLGVLNVEKDQYIRVGETLAVLDDIEQAEIAAQFTLEHFSPLVQPFNIKGMLANGESLSSGNLQLNAKVQLKRNGQPIEWDAHFVRMDAAVDPKTRTVGVVVAVDEPYAGAMPPLRPPLVKGMYVTVVLEGQVYRQQVAIPRQALHGDAVYVITPEQRLQRREVKVHLRQADFVTLASGLKPGDRVVVSDVVPAVEGMLLKPIEDLQIVEQLKRHSQHYKIAE